MPVDQAVVMIPQSIPRRATSARAGAAWLLLAFCVTGAASPAVAQEYRTDPIDKEAAKNKTIALASVRGTANYATERQKVLDYYSKCFFPEMTRIEPEHLAKLGPNRADLFRKTLWVTTNEAMQRDLTEAAFPIMQRFVVAKDPPYHPAVRLNAVLVIGMLDEQYAIESGANIRQPKPLPKANNFLVQIVKLGAEGKAVPPPILAGALIGLERHARFRDGLPRDAVEPMTTAVLKIATQDKPLLEMDGQVHAWMRFQAANILAQLGSVGTNNQAHDAIVKLVADGRTLDDRCMAAALTAKVKYDGAKVDGAATTEKMLKLASDVAEAEDKRAKEFQESQLLGGGGGAAYSAPAARGSYGPGRGSYGPGRGSYGPRGYGGEGGYGGAFGEEEPEDPYPRRHVLARLIDLRSGFTALKPVVPADAQAKFDAIITAINPAITAIADKETVSLKVAQAVVTMADTLKEVTGTAKDEAAEEADEAAAFAAPAETPAAAADAPPAAAPPAAETPTTTPPAAEAPAAAPPAAAPPEEAPPAEAPPEPAQ